MELDKQNKRVWVYLTTEEETVLEEYINQLPFKVSRSEIFRSLTMDKIRCELG